MRFDDRARVPFAFLGVLLLMISTLSMAYISALQSESYRNGIVKGVVQECNELSAHIHREVETEAYWIGTRAVLRTGGNHSRLVSTYEEMMESYFSGHFPRRVEGFEVRISNYSASILLESRGLNDFEEGVRMEKDTFEGKTYEEMQTDRSGYWTELLRIMTLSVQGHVTYIVAKGHIMTRDAHDFSTDLDSLFPFLKSKMENVLSDTASEFGNVARIVKYIISTLAQVRVLRSWGGSRHHSPSIDEIVTISDVERALNLALMLEEIGLLRTIDKVALDSFDSHNPHLDDGFNVSFLMARWLGEGTIDPSDLFLLHSGDAETEVTISEMISQAVYAMRDHFTLKFLQYFGIVPVVDLSIENSENLASSISDFLDWVSRSNSESWISSSWFKGVAGETKTSTLVSYPILFPVPEFNFQIVTENSGVVNFTLPEFDAYIPFEEVDLVADFDHFWESCFTQTYERDLMIVHESQRNLTKDMATRIGEFSEEAWTFLSISLNAIVPTDETSVLQNLSKAINERTDLLFRRLIGNQSFADSLIQTLWKAQANLAINIFSQIESTMNEFIGPKASDIANKTISQSLISLIEGDENYVNLSEEEKDRLSDAIREFVSEGEFGIEARRLLMDETVAKFRGMKERAVSLGTSSRDGGIHSKLRLYVASSSGILAMVAKAVCELADSIAESEDIENIPFLVSTTKRPFDFWDDRVELGRRILHEKRFTIQASRQPPYLVGEACGDELPIKDLRLGDLWISLETPLDFSTGSGNNVHYTDVTRFSAPFESTWRIKVRGLIELSIGTNPISGQIVGYQDRITKNVPLEFEISITTKSGWPLEGVSYDSSDTFLEDIWNAICDFFEAIWDGLLKVLDWILDGISKIVSLVSKVIGALLSYAQDILEAIEKAVEVTVELLQAAISSIASIIGGIIEGVISLFGELMFEISAFGARLLVALNQGNGTIFRGELRLGCFEATLLFAKIANMNLTAEQRQRTDFEYDAIVDLNVSFFQLDFQGLLDPAMVVSKSFFQANVTWGDEWRIDLQVPHVEKYIKRSYVLQIPPIPTPVGTVDIEFGFFLKLTEDLEDIDLVGILIQSFESAWAETLGEDVSIDSTARFVELGMSNAITEITSTVKENINRVIEIVLYFEGQLKVGAAAGIGVRLLVVLSKTVLSESFHWLSERLRDLVSAFGAPPSTTVECDLAGVLASETFIAFEIVFSLGVPRFIGMFSHGSDEDMEVVLAMSIRLNIATIGLLLGRHVGQWSIEFGIYLEGIPPSLIGESAQNGEVLDLWLLRGRAVQLA